MRRAPRWVGTDMRSADLRSADLQSANRWMKLQRLLPWVFLVLAMFVAPDAFAAGTSGASSITHTFVSATTGWYNALKSVAEEIFYTLFGIDFVYLVAQWLIGGKDVHEIFTSFMKKLLTIGFFYTVLLNGHQLIGWVINGFKSSGIAAAGAPHTGLGWILTTGGNLFLACVEGPTTDHGGVITYLWDTVASGGQTVLSSLTGELVGVAVGLIAILALIYLALEYLAVQIEAALVASVGIIMMGFAGSRWTVQHAEGYLKYALSVGIRFMVLVIWISFIENNSTGIVNNLLNGVKQDGGTNIATSISAYGNVLIFVLLIAWLTKKLPGLAASIMTGSSSLSGGDLLAGGITAAAVGAAAVATGGAALAGAGGAGALTGAEAAAMDAGASGSLGAAAGEAGASEAAGSLGGGAGEAGGAGSGVQAPDVRSQGGGEGAGVAAPDIPGGGNGGMGGKSSSSDDNSGSGVQAPSPASDGPAPESGNAAPAAPASGSSASASNGKNMGDAEAVRAVGAGAIAGAEAVAGNEVAATMNATGSAADSTLAGGAEPSPASGPAPAQSGPESASAAAGNETAAGNEAASNDAVQTQPPASSSTGGAPAPESSGQSPSNKGLGEQFLDHHKTVTNAHKIAESVLSPGEANTNGVQSAGLGLKHSE